MKRHIYIWIIVLQTLFAQSNNDLFTSANQLYKINDYQSAIRNYEQILSSSEHEDIYYNLGKEKLFLINVLSINSKLKKFNLFIDNQYQFFLA